MSVKIIVDSTADLLPEVRAQVTAVPLVVRFGDQEYMDGVSIQAEQFYAMLTSREELPTTSQPTPAAFETAFREAVEAGHEVVCITVSSQLSGTYQSATIAADEFPGKVFVVDSRTAAIGTSVLTAYALQLAEQGLCGEQILQELIQARKRVRLYAIVDTLEYLKKGGRLSATVAAVGGLLGIKPLICLDETGQIKVAGTARGLKKAFALLTEECAKCGGPDLSRPALLGYTGESNENMRKYQQENLQMWPSDIRGTIVGAAIGVHVGPGAVAAAFFCKE